MVAPIRDRKEQSAIDTLTRLGYEYVDDGVWAPVRVPAPGEPAIKQLTEAEYVELVRARTTLREIGYDYDGKEWRCQRPAQPYVEKRHDLAISCLTSIGYVWSESYGWLPPLPSDRESASLPLAAESAGLLQSLGYVWSATRGWQAPKTSALAKQEGGEHYKQMPLQPWEIIERNKLDFWQGNVIKYAMRYKSKGGAEDLRKAVHYLEYLIEREQTTTR